MFLETIENAVQIAPEEEQQTVQRRFQVVVRDLRRTPRQHLHRVHAVGGERRPGMSGQRLSETRTASGYYLHTTTVLTVSLF